MKPTKTTNLFLIAILASFGFSTSASADHDRPYVNYDLIIQHSEDLEYIATDLKEHLRDQFHHSRHYGKLISLTTKIKSRAHRLHRYGTAKRQYQWHDEIHYLDELVCDLIEQVDYAMHHGHHGHGSPTFHSTRTVRKLLAKAEYHVKGLEKSIRRIEQSQYNNGPAPNYRRNNQSIGYGVYRTGNFYQNNWNQRFTNRNNYPANNKGIYGPRGLAGVNVDHHGVALDVGGFKFYLNK